MYPKKISHWLNGAESFGGDPEALFPKIDPATGSVIAMVARGGWNEAENAVSVAASVFGGWSNTSIVRRAEILRSATALMETRREEIARIVSKEAGKSLKDAQGEVTAAIELGFFMSGEGRRNYGRTTASAVPHRFAYTVRQPVGVCALIIAANTPIANVAWKAFPALISGNAAVMKPSENTPYSALWFAKILKEAGLPDGVFNVLQGFGEEAGAVLVEDERVELVSFTGSVEVGKRINVIAGGRLARVCLELGGKNPFIVCDDADLPSAAESAALSAFSNAGQRCASASRIIVFDAVYDDFKRLFTARTLALRLGVGDDDDLGPVINARQLEKMLRFLEKAKTRNAVFVCGGHRVTSGHCNGGYYLAPTILENVPPEDEISRSELFGPITCLYRAKDFTEALAMANDSPFALTGAIHTRNVHRSQEFIVRYRAGVVSVNGHTYGSEPHMPFGGLKQSGNGWREPGSEALDAYSELKTVYIKHDPGLI